MIETIFTALLLIFILWVLFAHYKTTEKRAKVINMSFFSIKSIDDFILEADLINVFREMHLKGWNRFLYGDPYISLEKVIRNGAPEYYIAIPKKYEEILAGDPHVLKTEQAVLPQDKHYAAAYLDKRQPFIKFSDAKLGEEEGIVLQILARHSHDGISHFESNVRVLSWARSLERAKKILNLEKVKKRTVNRVVFDFLSRIFENSKRVRIGFGELKNFLINKFVY
jgi:hypothetical protein